MYNGIGLQTARGSGTNGYVQANRASLHVAKKRVEYNSEADIKRAEAELLRKPNAELLEHMKKRQIELKCADFELLMENKGFDEAEIEKKVSEYRKLLYSQLEAGTLDVELEINLSDTHVRAKVAAENWDRMRSAFGISDSFVDGSSFDNINKKNGLDKEKVKVEPAVEKGHEKKSRSKRAHKSSSSSSSTSSESSSSSDSSSESNSTVTTYGSDDSDSSSDSDSDQKSSTTTSSSEEEASSHVAKKKAKRGRFSEDHERRSHKHVK